MNRRNFINFSAAATCLAALPSAGWSLTEASARRLIDSVVADINRIISSAKSDQALYADFERVLTRYADMDYIAASTLGPDGRSASNASKRAYQAAFQGYISRKYGKRFQDFVGGEIEVQNVQRVRQYYEVSSIARLRGQSPFQVDFLVINRTGKDLFFDMKIEGVSLLLTERREIGTLLDRRRGDVAALARDLEKLG